MSKGAQTQLVSTKSLSYPSSYVKAMYDQYREWVFDEEEAPLLKGSWREKVFKAPAETPLDLEIGPGSGGFLHYISQQNKDRLYLSIELKYKPLIQSARKIKKSRCDNARLIRHNGRLLKNIFAREEINNVYIYFPDPWPKKRHHKHRLLLPDFVYNLYSIQKPHSFVEIKTDHLAYFSEMQKVFQKSPYIAKIISKDLHQRVAGDTRRDPALPAETAVPSPHFGFTTFFEKIFIKQNHPICYARYAKGISTSGLKDEAI